MLVHVLLAAFAALAIANDANYTLDDKHNALRYLPDAAWSQFSTPCAAPSCSWHQALPDSGAELQLSFVGTALYLFSIPFPLFLNLSFSLDGRPLPPYAQIPTDSLVLALSGLSNTRHDFRVVVEPNSTFLFDYLVYTVQEPTFTLRIQPRQEPDNAPQQNQTDTPPTPIPSTNPQEQIGAIAGAIAAAVGITSLFSIGLAISIVKIRRQRLRNRREREAELERTQGLSLHLPSASVSAAARVPLPRYTQPPPDPTAVLDPPPVYDAVMRLASRNATVLARLPPIEEVATIRSSQASRLSSRRVPSPREGTVDDVPGNPPGLSAVADHPSEETIRASQDPSCPSEHHHQE